jgi:hypothetical protein
MHINRMMMKLGVGTYRDLAWIGLLSVYDMETGTMEYMT